MPRAIRSALNHLCLPATGALILVGWSGTALAEELTFVAAGDTAPVAQVELIGSSRLGCGEGVPLWTATNGGTQCAFDTAVRGLRMNASDRIGSATIEAYATVARTTSGAFSPDTLLIAPDHRSNEATDFMMVGVKSSAFDNRLKLTAEFARTQRVVDELIDRQAFLPNRTSDSGTSAFLRFDATLADRPGLKWSLAGEYRSVSDDYAVGRSPELLRHFAMPGTRLAISTKARVGTFGLSGAMEQLRTPFGSSTSRKVGVDLDGLSLRLVSREASAAPPAGSTLLDSRTRSSGAYLDIDPAMVASSLLPELGELPALMPTTISLSYKSSETKSRYEGFTDRYEKSSFGVDGTWDTRIGETSLSYWRDRRIGLADSGRSWTSETFQLSHSLAWGNWRIGMDASVVRIRGEGSSGYDDRALSFGQSLAYSVPDGPQFRLELGQDRSAMRMHDDSYLSSDSYSSVTASLDLSRYLQKRFERPDLRLTLDYRKAVERSDSEMSLYDELVERWIDGSRREGLLMSFGMKL